MSGEDFSDVLRQLADADGAILYWQTDRATFEPALKAGAIKQVGELFVHPDAIEVEAGMCYTMPASETFDELSYELGQFCGINGLPEMSADELLCELQAVKSGEASAFVAPGSWTAHREQYLTNFIERWNEAERERDRQRAADSSSEPHND